jgi:hypothetical protein
MNKKPGDQVIPRDKDGRPYCADCGKAFATPQAALGHRRWCEGTRGLLARIGGSTDIDVGTDPAVDGAGAGGAANAAVDAAANGAGLGGAFAGAAAGADAAPCAGSRAAVAAPSTRPRLRRAPRGSSQPSLAAAEPLEVLARRLDEIERGQRTLQTITSNHLAHLTAERQQPAPDWRRWARLGLAGAGVVGLIAGAAYLAGRRSRPACPPCSPRLRPRRSPGLAGTEGTLADNVGTTSAAWPEPVQDACRAACPPCPSGTRSARDEGFVGELVRGTAKTLATKAASAAIASVFGK